MANRNSFQLSELKAGFVFDCPVYSEEGYKLMEPFTPLTTQHLKRLNEWGFDFVVADNQPLSAARQDEIRAEARDSIIDEEELMETVVEQKTEEILQADHSAVEPAQFYEKRDKIHVEGSYEQAFEKTQELLDRLSRGVVGRQQELFQALRPAFNLIWNYQLLLIYLLADQELDDNDYFYHYSLNTALLAMIIADSLGYDKDEVRYIGVGGLIHDVGMLKIPQSIRKKEGRFNAREKETVRQHVKKTAESFRRFRNLADSLKKVAAQHHEHWDGSGYPEELQGKDIHPHARIVNLAMTYVAMTQPRYHRKRVGIASSMREVIYKEKKKFDPEVLKAFIRVMGIYPPGSFVKLSSGHHALIIKNKPARPLNPVVRVITDRAGKLLKEPYRLFLQEENTTVESLLDREKYGYSAFEIA